MGLTKDLQNSKWNEESERGAKSYHKVQLSPSTGAYVLNASLRLDFKLESNSTHKFLITVDLAIVVKFET